MSHINTQQIPTTATEWVRLHHYVKSDSHREILFVFAGYYTGQEALKPLANQLAAADYYVVVIEPFGAPTWIDQTINFTADTPPLLQAWTSACLRAVSEVCEMFPTHHYHFVGYSMGGPAAVLTTTHGSLRPQTLSLIAPIGIQSRCESFSMWLRRWRFTRLLGYGLGTLLLTTQVLHLKWQKWLARFNTYEHDRYAILTAERHVKAAEGAASIAHTAGDMKLRFNLSQYMSEISYRAIQIQIIVHQKDVYISANRAQQFGLIHKIPVHCTKGTHDCIKLYPERVTPLILELIHPQSQLS